VGGALEGVFTAGGGALTLYTMNGRSEAVPLLEAYLARSPSRSRPSARGMVCSFLGGERGTEEIGLNLAPPIIAVALLWE
jgi:hypothetical protein